MSRAILAFFCAIVLNVPTRAAEEAVPQPQAYVVLVGIDKYADAAIKPREHAEDDAKAFYDLLSSKDYLGVKQDHIRLLLGATDEKRKSQPATHANVVKALQWLAEKSGKDDLVIFAFFGEGAPHRDQACYFCSDSTLKGRAKDALVPEEIAHEMNRLKSQKFCAFIDVNFKGFDGGKDAPAEADPEKIYQEYFGNEKDEDELPQKAGRIVFAANDGLSPPLAVEKHGLFARVILDGLKGAADKEGYEPDGVVTIDELVEYVGKVMPGLIHKHGKTDDEKKEFPVILGARLNHFVLTQNPAVMPKVRERLAKLAQLKKDNKITAEIAEEGQNLLSRMPKLDAQRNLRKEYQKLADGGLEVKEFLDNRTNLVSGTKLQRDLAEKYAKKVMEAIDQIGRKYVKEVSAGELTALAIRGLYARVDEKIPSDISERLSKAKSLRKPELRSLLADAREKLGKREDLADHKDIDVSLQRMLFRLDPHSTYFDKDTVERFKQDTQGEFTGIGAQVGKEAGRDLLKIITPIKGSPAYKKGLQAGDLITSIIREEDNDGNKINPPEVTSTKGMKVEEAVKKILGKPGTKVKLAIERDGKPMDVEIERGKVEVETVIGARRKDDDSWDFYIDPTYQIAYIHLTQFSRNTFRDLFNAMKDLDKKGVKGVVLDLRFNPGGLLDSAVKISEMFMGDGLIVNIKPRIGEQEPYYSQPKDPQSKNLMDRGVLNPPMAVLINGHSASASEIVSACLQDHGRAVVIGERSYGKGSVQNIQTFDGGEMKLTIATYWRPSGKNIHRGSTGGKDEDEWGVLPSKGFEVKQTPRERGELEEAMRDREVIARKDKSAPNEAKTEFKDRQLEKALEYLREQIKIASRLQAKKAS
jgi:C-terminal peptidase prc